MKLVLLSAAAAAVALVPTVPATAAPGVPIGTPDAKSFSRPPLLAHPVLRHRFDRPDRNDERSADILWGGYDLQSSYDATDWAPDTGNDWWHDRPDRAFPRWVRHNENCTPDRMWWSGSGWHC